MNEAIIISFPLARRKEAAAATTAHRATPGMVVQLHAHIRRSETRPNASRPR